MSLPAIDLGHCYSVAEFEALPEFGGHYELVDGRIIEKSMPGDEHFAIIRRIIVTLVLLDPTGKLGAFWSQTSINFGRGWIPLPDFAFTVANRVLPRTSGSVQGVPDFVVEVHSPSDLDSKPARDAAQNKIRQYQDYDVKLIWAINPRTHTIEIYHPDQPSPITVKGIGDTLDCEGIIPGFSLPVAELFA